MNIVPLSPKVGYVSDVVGELRALADEIEAGTHGAVENALVIVTTAEVFEPLARCYGPQIGRHRCAGLFMHGSAMVLALTEPE